MAQRPQDQMEIDAIDSLLGEPTPRVKPRVETPMPRVTELPRVGGPALSRETPGLTDEPTLVGAHGGATTMPAPGPTPPPAPPPAPTPPVASDTPTATTTSTGTSGVGTTAGTGTGAPSRAAGAGGNLQDAYNNFRGSIDPNASRQDMEAAIDRHFSSVPGYRGAYKESVNINGTWYDLVSGYGGANASFQLLPKTGGGAGAGLFGAGMGMGVPALGGLPALNDESRLNLILESIDAMARGEGGPLVKQSIDQELGAEGVTPLADPIAEMQRAATAVQGPRPRARVGL